MVEHLDEGAILQFMTKVNGELRTSPTVKVQVLEIKWNEKGRFDLIISDGANRCRSVLAPKHTQQIREGKIIQNSVVELTGYIIMKAQSHDGHFVVMIKELSVVQLQCVQIGSPSPLPAFYSQGAPSTPAPTPTCLVPESALAPASVPHSNEELSGQTAFIVSGAEGNELKLWDLGTGDVSSVLVEHRASTAIHSMSLSSDGRRLFLATMGMLKVVDAQNGETIYLCDTKSPICCAALSEDCTKAICGHWDPKSKGRHGPFLQHWDLRKGEVIRELYAKRKVNAVVLFASGTRCLTGSCDHFARLYDVFTGEVLQKVDAREEVKSVAVSRDGTHAIIGTCGTSRNLKVYAIGTDKLERVPVQLQGHTGPVESVALSPCARFAVSGGADNKAIVWQVAEGNRIVTVSLGKGGVKSISMSADSTLAMCGSHDGSLTILDVISGGVLCSFQEPSFGADKASQCRRCVALLPSSTSPTFRRSMSASSSSSSNSSFSSSASANARASSANNTSSPPSGDDADGYDTDDLRSSPPGARSAKRRKIKNEATGASSLSSSAAAAANSASAGTSARCSVSPSANGDLHSPRSEQERDNQTQVVPTQLLQKILEELQQQRAAQQQQRAATNLVEAQNKRILGMLSTREAHHSVVDLS